MAGEELQVIRLKDDFYRDGFRKVMLILGIIGTAIILLIATSVYLYVEKPSPVNFATDSEWRIVAPVPLDQPYLNTFDLLQWVSDTLPAVFNYDFVHYTNQLKNNAQYFTENGWEKFQDIINDYAAANTVENSKLFITAVPAGAPFVLNQGVLQGKYGWWVQMPLDINYSGIIRPYTQSITFQVLVLRVSTLNNLYGVEIENIIIPENKAAGGAIGTNG